ncbi:MAG TPA: hypothetical protein VM759_03270, partial [Longimicrobium sp.]|nr:hypothetical protein [Longimicrobium sp.]
RVSLFHAPFGEDAARRVAAAGVAELDALEQRALLRRTRDGRWRVHGLVRDYAQAKLDDFPRERAEAAAAYRDHHLARLRDAGPALEGTDSVDASAAALEAELPDLRRAWELAAREGPADGLAAAADALLALLARRGAWAEAELRFAGAAGWLAARGGAEDALRRLETRLAIARVALERPGDAAPLLRRALAAAVRGRDAAEEAVCLVTLARAHLGDGEPRLARGAAASAVSAADRAGDGSLRVRALCVAAESELAEAGYREAVEALYEAVEVEPGSVAAVEAWHQLVATAAVLLRAGQLSLAAVLLSRTVSGAAAPPECVARAQTLLAELRASDQQQPPSAVPALVIVSPDAPALRSAIDPAPSPPPPTRISA